MSISIPALERFLRRVDGTFPVPISEKQELYTFALKLSEKATLCAEYDGEEIAALCAGYTENLTDGLAYISVVATLPEYRGKGFAKKLVRQFIKICEDKNIRGVHLYAVPENTAAVNMYRSLGFLQWEKNDEQRPGDTHFIYNIK